MKLRLIIATAVAVASASTTYLKPRDDGQCGPAFGNPPCRPGNCCSTNNYCGSTTAHCHTSCQYDCGTKSVMPLSSTANTTSTQTASDSGIQTTSSASSTAAPTPTATPTGTINWNLPPRQDGVCGPAVGNPPCKCGNVCSKWNACGATETHIKNCQYMCDLNGPCPTSTASPSSSSPAPVSTTTIPEESGEQTGPDFEPQYNEDGVIQSCKSPGLVALTFHGFPDPVRTSKIVDVFEKSGHKATFFWYGENMNKKGEFIRNVVNRGHEVGLRGWKDRSLLHMSPQLAVNHIDRTQRLFERMSHKYARFFRAPQFKTNDLYEDLLEVNSFVHVFANMQLHHKIEEEEQRAIAEEYEDNMECSDPTKNSFIVSHRQDIDLDLLADIILYIRWTGYKLVTLAECLGEPAYRQPNCA